MTAPAATLQGARILVGVSGGIAAYKAAHVVRGLVASGADVRVIPTPSSLAFVGAATWEALSHHRVITSVFEDVDQVAHVRLGQEADLVVVVPATADLLARTRMGRADDLLTATLLMAGPRAVLVPAMHTEMWENPATRENVAVLRERGLIVLEPAVGRLTGPDSGPGRLPVPEAILESVRAVLAARRGAPDADGLDEGELEPAIARTDAAPRDLAGVRVLVTAGGTREDIDPVRYLANHSSGKQGWALAHAAIARGAEVTLLAANVALPAPPGARLEEVRSAADLAAAVARYRRSTDVLIMAAAVADFTPASRAEAKIKKTEDDAEVPVIALRRTEDILRASVLEREERRSAAGGSTGSDSGSGRSDWPRVIVGFAAETGDATTTSLVLGQEKARRKGADLLVLNDVTSGVFGADRNAVTILDAAGELVADAEGEKVVVAHAVLDQVARALREQAEQTNLT